MTNHGEYKHHTMFVSSIPKMPQVSILTQKVRVRIVKHLCWTVHDETLGGLVDPDPTPQDLSVSNSTVPMDEPDDMVNADSPPP